MVTAAAPTWNVNITELFPQSQRVSDLIPPRARDYLEQAKNSLHAPAGAVMLAASSVDAMLKAKGYKEGSLYERIQKAADDHLITNEMALWAHEVRLDANDTRHDDEDEPIADQEAAQRAIDFVSALGEFIFVLPARVQRGRINAGATVTEGAPGQK